MAFKDHQKTSLVGIVEGGYNDAGQYIRLRRTLSDISTDVTPDQAFAAAVKIFDLQQLPLMELQQVDTHNLYQ